jgi:hypothetical protein
MTCCEASSLGMEGLALQVGAGEVLEPSRGNMFLELASWTSKKAGMVRMTRFQRRTLTT